MLSMDEIGADAGSTEPSGLMLIVSCANVDPMKPMRIPEDSRVNASTSNNGFVESSSSLLQKTVIVLR
jgi:hypothetical protein